jgi:hypothetical protein
MKAWAIRLLLVALCAALGFLVWRVISSTPEQVIRKRMIELARLASFPPNEAPMAKLANSRKLASFFTSDVEITIDLPGRSQQTVSGRDEVLQAAIGARSLPGGIQVDFPDVKVTLGADKQSATVNLTAKGNVGGDRDNLLQELKLTLKKIEGNWLINRVETIKTLL